MQNATAHSIRRGEKKAVQGWKAVERIEKEWLLLFRQPSARCIVGFIICSLRAAVFMV